MQSTIQISQVIRPNLVGPVFRTPLTKLLVIMLIFAFGSLPVAAKRVTTASGETDAGTMIYSPYKPKEVTSLRSLPNDVRVRVTSHILARIGSDFYRRLQFDGGEIVDVKRLRHIMRGTNRFPWEVPVYSLRFRLAMPEIGIRLYVAGIELRGDGSVIKEISLPAFQSTPDKRHFVPLAAAYDIAATRGFSPDRIDVEIIYDRKRDAMMWHFSQLTHHEVGLTKYREIEIDAHTGAVLRVFNTETET